LECPQCGPFFVRDEFFLDRIDLCLLEGQSPPRCDDHGDGRDALPLDLSSASDREALGFSLLLALSYLSGFGLVSMRSRRINRRSRQFFPLTPNAAAHAFFNLGLLICILELS
jgi:hypothetical protein